MGILGWMRINLFSSPLNILLTIVSVYLIWLIVPPVIEWAFIDAIWDGTNRDACLVENAGACWAFIDAKFGQIVYGRYTVDERWRVDLVYLLGACTLIPLLFEKMPGRRYLALFLILVYPVITFILLTGGSFGLPHVETALWGGLLVTLVVAVVGIVASLPLGILLALGRRSDMPVVRMFCIGFIELWRGVPLITVLFMASVMLPLFLPEGVNFDKLIRVLIGVALFSSAYMAEVIRGGLQAIPRGQYEAAHALGLSYWQSMGFVILPQALRMVIPGIVNTFIGLFKDTTLVLIVGLFDLLGIIQLNFTDPNWSTPQTAATGYAFAGLIFWAFCFGMSRYSIRVESRLNEGTRRA
ncbi:MAG TPA: amino acid ABC transporter permease [Alphaproteobacteria bacterium]|nr:amino acid ABC transporter permease [Alphaproteobacteria bacterium]